MCAVNPLKNQISDAQWNLLPDEIKERCQNSSIYAERIGNLSLEQLEKIVSDWKTQNDGAVKKKENVGTEVQKTNVSKLDEMKPKVDLSSMEDKDMRKVSVEQWTKYFEARYKENPAEASYDIARVLKRKEVAKVQAGLQNMLNDAKLSKTVKAKYFAEGFATQKEQSTYDEKVKDLQARYKQNPEEAINHYNGLFRVDKYNDPVDHSGHLTDEQMDALVKLKALDSIEIDGDQLENMAVTAVVEQTFNKGIQKANEYLAEVEELKVKGMTPEAKQLQREIIAQDIKYDKQAAKLLEEAETDESKKLFNDLAKYNKETDAEIVKQKRLGNTAKVEELTQQQLEKQKEAQKAIKAAMNQDKLKEAEEVAKKRYEARIAGEKAVYEKIDPKTREKIATLEAKAKAEINKANNDSNNEVIKDVSKIAEIMAETQVDKQRAEARYNRTTIHWEDGKNTDNDKERHVYLDKDMREYIQDNPKIFADEVPTSEANFVGTKLDPETGKEVQVGYKFNSDKFKNYMLRLSNENQLDNEENDDASFKADYYANIKERKEQNDAKRFSYAERAKLSDRRFAKKCYDAAGIDTEKDKSVGKRWGNLAKSVGIGAGIGAAAATLSEYLSTTKVVHSKFFKIVEYAGSVPYAQIVHVKGQTDATLTGRYQGTHHVEGDQAYHQDIEVSGTATGQVTLGYSGSGTAHYTGQQGYTYSGGGTVTGTVNGVASGDYSGVASGSVPVEHTHTDYINGRPAGTKTWTTDQHVDIPYSGQVNIPYEQGYSQDYTYSGSGTVDYEGDVGYKYSGTTTGEAKIPYKQVVSADGTVHWEADVKVDEEVTLKGKADYETDVKVEGEAEYKGEKEVSGETSTRPKMDLGVIGKAAIIGAIGGAAKGLAVWNKIYDEGGREEAVARQALSEKGVDQKTVTPLPEPEPAPAPVQPITPAPAPAPVEDDCRADAEDLSKSNKPVETFEVKSKNLADIISKKYGITNSKDLYKAIGIVKGWHGISEADRKKNIYIKQLGLRESITIGDKVYSYISGIDRKNIADNGKPEVKADGWGTYARVEVKAGKVILSCGGSEYHYDSYEMAKDVAKFYNEHKRMPNNDELATIKENLNK